MELFPSCRHVSMCIYVCMYACRACAVLLRLCKLSSVSLCVRVCVCVCVCVSSPHSDIYGSAAKAPSAHTTGATPTQPHTEHTPTDLPPLEMEDSQELKRRIFPPEIVQVCNAVTYHAHARVVWPYLRVYRHRYLLHLLLQRYYSGVW